MYASARLQGLTDEMVDEVPNFRQSPLFTPAEKAAMRLADAMAGDHKNAPFDEVFAELRKYYTEEQIVELGWRTSVFIGYGRLVYALGVDAIGQSCRLPHLATAAAHRALAGSRSRRRSPKGSSGRSATASRKSSASLTQVQGQGRGP